MSTKVAILGVAGMLGHKMFQRLRAQFTNTTGFMRGYAARPPLSRVDFLQGSDVVNGLDVLNFDALSATLSAIRPDFVVNCVGVIKQRAEACDPVTSIAVNSLLPHRLAALAQSWGGRLIHFSTDCVFSGDRGNYTEDDEPDARDLYGRSKFLGEAAGENALTLRTSIIGRELGRHLSLLDWFLAQNGRTVRGFRRVIYSGVTTNHLADVVADIMRGHPHLHGLYQVASAPISKYDLLTLIREAYSLAIEITPDETERSDRSMRGDKFRCATGYVAPPWPALVAQLASDSTPYESW